MSKNNKTGISVLKWIIIGIMAVAVISIAGVVLYFTGRLSSMIEPPNSSIFVDPSATVPPMSSATPRPDAYAEYVSGKSFDGYIFQTEELSTAAPTEATEQFKLIAKLTDGDFFIAHISVMMNDELSDDYDFGEPVRLYIPLPEGFDGSNVYVYLLSDDVPEKAEVSFNGTFIVVEVEHSHDIAVTKKLLTDIAPTPAITLTPTVTPVPSETPTPIVTPTPTVTPTPIVTPTPTVIPTPTVTPTPTVIPTPTITPTPTVIPTPTPTITPKPTPTPVPTPTPTVEPAPTLNPGSADVINIVLFGLDTTNEDPNYWSGNSDTIMILSIDTKNNEMKLTSIMRDLYVPIYDDNNNLRGNAKINSAFWRGPAASINTIQNYFNIKIDHYAVIKFNGMKAVIDILGGVDINITKNEVPHMHNPRIQEAGTYRLAGWEALAYMRIRAADNDRYRTLRQGNVLQSLVDKFKDASWTQLLSLLDECVQYVKTDMDMGTMTNVALAVYNAREKGLSRESYPYGYTSSFWTCEAKDGWLVHEVNKEYQMDWFHKRIYGYTE